MSCIEAHPELGVVCDRPLPHGMHMHGRPPHRVEWRTPVKPSDDATMRDVVAAIAPEHRGRPIVGRNDPQNAHVAAARIEPKRGTRNALVLLALRSANGDWVEGTYLETPEVGGAQGTRRARELRAMGWPIELRPHPSSDTAWQYRLIPEGPRLRNFD